MSDGPEQHANVFEALMAVMEDVQAIRKGDINKDLGFRFRGIDAVLNAVGPAFRKHHVMVVPVKTESRYRDVRTSTDKPSRECTVVVTYRFYGPGGKDDFLDAEVPGESMDVGDKGTPKAMSVALRILLLQTLAIPTDEPDPDEYTYERASVQAPAAPDPLMAAKLRAFAAVRVLHPELNPADEAQLAQLRQFAENEMAVMGTTSDEASAEMWAALAEQWEAEIEQRKGQPS